MIGDSVTLASAQALQERLPGIGIDAQVSRTIEDGIDLLRQEQESGQLRRIVVISLSTNSAITPEHIQQLTDIAEKGQVRQIVLVTGQAPQQLGWVEQSNRVEREAAGREARISVADWAKASAGRPELLVSDGVHPQPEGQALYAQTIAEAVKTAQTDLQRDTASSTEN